ncbi:PP2C family serine/threonine-protein phosphatase [Arachnia propionica]|uniref:PP2C family protein-serine/threonine phosphatase n=1 Tax=Arachnia propionica TaxID=1750 RepID=UPI00163A324B|nr:PP2C family protein-serine/threonine phosphatase [Arachnia propionica]
MTNVEDGASPNARHHYVASPVPWLAGCSDRGRRHPTNQDALNLAARDLAVRQAVLVVSDGVSTAHGSERASLIAAETACSTLMGALSGPGPDAKAFRAAFGHAHEAVLAAAPEGEASACTLVAAAVQGSRLLVGSIGDSRAYWFGDDGATWQLTQDDSMAQARMMLGMAREEAEASLQAHSITRWLGRNASDVTPALVELRPPSAGWLLLCSDGLWNYASAPDALRAVLEYQTRGRETLVAIVEALATWANDLGGRDNITVALLRHEL